MSSAPRVHFQCFGNFDVFIDGRPVNFHYAKAKEMLAYMVDMRSLCSNQEIMEILWEDGSSPSYFQNIRKDLLDVFRAAGCENIFFRQRGRMGVDTTKVSCDFYDLLKEDPAARRAYLGEYMRQYEWAEYTNQKLVKRLNPSGM